MNPMVVIAEDDAGLTLVGTVATKILAMVGDVYDEVIDKPILLIPIAAAALATAIGLFRSLTGQRRRGRR